MAKDPVRRWDVVESAWAFRSQLLGVRLDRCRLPDGRLSPDFYFMSFPDFSMTVPLTLEGDVLFAREYKHGAADVMLTLPAGFVEDGESPEEAARRELLEETGYDGGTLEPLGSFMLVPSLSSVRGHFFLARHPAKVAEPRLDEFERIEVVAIPLGEVKRDYRRSPRQYLVDVSSVLALGLAFDRLDRELPLG